VGLPQYPSPSAQTQAPRGHYRQRRCLLKGCEQPFHPHHPQERYCSAGCRQQARQWRRWHSTQTYRASPAGQERRRQQARRYREQQRQQQAARWEQPLQAIEEQVAQEAAVSTDPDPAAQLTPEAPREGQRPATQPPDFSGQPCQRPGCYVLVPLRSSRPRQRFCSCQCRQALRRVLDREARWRWRRRRQRRQPPPRPRSRPPPS
jgi:hypothetical protein